MDKLKEYAIGSSDLTYDLIERILNDGTKLVLGDEARKKSNIAANISIAKQMKILCQFMA